MQSFYGELEPEHGEDALPIGVECEAPKFSIHCVCDGLGGSGSEKYTLDGKGYTGAQIASEYARKAILDLSSDYKIWSKEDEFIKKILKDRIIESLNQAQATYEKVPSRLKSKMYKTLPSTFALSVVNAKDKSVRYFWAGDSRIYLFSSKNQSLKFLSYDDTDEIEPDLNNPDTYNYMMSHTDGRMNNCINLTKDFHINSGAIENLNDGDIIIVATDGVYGCFSDHSEFQKYLLDHCFRSGFDITPLKDYVETNKRDDYSFASTVIGSKTKPKETVSPPAVPKVSKVEKREDLIPPSPNKTLEPVKEASEVQVESKKKELVLA